MLGDLDLLDNQAGAVLAGGEADDWLGALGQCRCGEERVASKSARMPALYRPRWRGVALVASRVTASNGVRCWPLSFAPS